MTLKITEYVHASNDELAPWERALGDEYMNSDAARRLHYRLMELAVDLEIDIETGTDRILEIRYGNQILRPVEQ